MAIELSDLENAAEVYSDKIYNKITRTTTTEESREFVQEQHRSAHRDAYLAMRSDDGKALSSLEDVKDHLLSLTESEQAEFIEDITLIQEALQDDDNLKKVRSAPDTVEESHNSEIEVTTEKLQITNLGYEKVRELQENQRSQTGLRIPEGITMLTFDDGPTPGVTDEILDILKENNARATFFIRTDRLESQEGRDLLRRIVAEGHEIGLHTRTHQNLGLLDPHSPDYENIMEAEITRAKQDILEVVPEAEISFFRAPYGASDDYDPSKTGEARIKDYAETTNSDITDRVNRQGMSVAYWTLNGEMENQSIWISESERREKLLESESQIVLLHDKSDQQATVNALREALPELIERGVQPVTMSEVFHANP